jgi:hypothetical protein
VEVGAGVGLTVAGGGLMGSSLTSKTDLLAQYNQTCAEACGFKQDEEQAQKDADAAHAQAVELGQAYQRANDYLATQLRDDYLSRMRNRVYATRAATAIGGPIAWSFAIGNLFPFQGQPSFYTLDYGAWNAEIAAEKSSAYPLIRGIYQAKFAQLQAEFFGAVNWGTQASAARQQLRWKLINLRASKPEGFFPDCECE